MNKFLILMLLGTTFAGSPGFAMHPDDITERNKERGRQGLPPLGQPRLVLEPLIVENIRVYRDKQNKNTQEAPPKLPQQPIMLGVPEEKRKSLSVEQKQGIERDLLKYYKKL
jgi:hypothetical protein